MCHPKWVQTNWCMDVRYSGIPQKVYKFFNAILCTKRLDDLSQFCHFSSVFEKKFQIQLSTGTKVTERCLFFLFIFLFKRNFWGKWYFVRFIRCWSQCFCFIFVYLFVCCCCFFLLKSWFPAEAALSSRVWQNFVSTKAFCNFFLTPMSKLFVLFFNNPRTGEIGQKELCLKHRCTMLFLPERKGGESFKVVGEVGDLWKCSRLIRKICQLIHCIFCCFFLTLETEKLWFLFELSRVLKLTSWHKFASSLSTVVIVGDSWG